MKKLIVLAMIAASCSNDVTISKEEYLKLKGGTSSYYPKPFYFKAATPRIMVYDWSINLGSDNHEYLANNGINSFIVIHSPECKKCKKL